MAQAWILDLDVAGTVVPAISWTTGNLYGSKDRSHAPEHHMTIEVPAIMDILQSIASGAFTAEQAIESLGRRAAAINEVLEREQDELERLMDMPTPRREKVRKKDRRPVYAISSEQEPKIIKIGVTRTLSARLKALQTASVSPLAVRWTTQEHGSPFQHQEYGEQLERGLHDVFQERRMSGEWFDFRDVADPIELIRNAAHDVMDHLEESDGSPGA
ncbi:GIY-YIG nuclease family protein [Streptomyces sp. NPDC051577]|uniref:GIY-YIG nuclease family protein n=1 Tax=Streptomyces sp. NPDC051577 TaxID=3155166 RepID=UPI00343CC93D